MERRTFLKIIGLGIAGIGLTYPMKLVEALIPSEYLVREIIQHDMDTGSWVARYDVGTGKDRWHVAFSIYDPENIEKYRPQALELLFDYLKKKQIDISDLRPLPIPPGMEGQYVKGYQG